jgi:signal transduction histidine kinase
MTGAVAGGGGAALAAAALLLAFLLLARRAAQRNAAEGALQAILEHVDQGIMMMAADRRVIACNRRAMDLLDIPAELVASKPLFDEILRFQWDRGEFGPEGADVDEPLRQFLASGGVSPEVHRYDRRRPDGTTVAISTIPLEGGGAVRTYTDITAIRNREAALQAALQERDKAEAALRERGDDLEREVAERTRPLVTSESRHRDVAEVASDWFWETDLENRLTFVSKRFGETSGIPWAQVVGRSLVDLAALGFDPAGMDELRAVIEARGVFQDVIHRVVLAGRVVRFWRMSGKPFFDTATGAFAGYRGTGTDVTIATEREAALNSALLRAEAAEQEARQARSRLVDAIEAIPEGFVLHDADDRLVLCNARYAEIYGHTGELRTPGIRFEDVLRATVGLGYHSLDGKSVDEWIAERVARHRASGGNRMEQRLSNGRWLQVDERRTSDGGTVGIRVDVTEARQREAAERDREKLAALGQLAGGVAHEINNLLQPAITLPELVRDRLPPEDAESREDLDCVTEAARKVRDIVRNILLYARKEEPRLVPLDLAAALRGTIDFVRGVMPPSIAVCEVDLDTCAGCRVAANRTQLTQVLTNLVVNAAQATKGTGTVTVSVARTEPAIETAAELGIEAGRGYMTVSVADTGCGMDQATLARIFEPFFTTKPVGQGTGLGLSVAYGIMRSWQGAITVRSAPGEGTTFILYIPELRP